MSYHVGAPPNDTDFAAGHLLTAEDRAKSVFYDSATSPQLHSASLIRLQQGYTDWHAEMTVRLPDLAYNLPPEDCTCSSWSPGGVKM